MPQDDLGEGLRPARPARKGTAERDERARWREQLSLHTRFDLILVTVCLVFASVAYFAHPNAWDFLAALAAAVALGTMLLKALFELERAAERIG